MNKLIAQKALVDNFGYKEFRPMQLEIIESIYNQQDVIVLMPTGGGKSICYQVPAITMEGTGVIVSPLISLMRDQVGGLKVNGIKAAYINSSQSFKEQRQIEEQFHKGALDLLYVSPEKLCSQEFLTVIKASKVNLFAIDEAHCISAWGHDFRPEYNQLRFLKTAFPNIPIIALTATADKTTRNDIVSQLNLIDPKFFVASFDRPNLSITVKSGRKRFQQIISFIRQRPQDSGIIYCLSRKSTESLASKLSQSGINAAYYHAGLSSESRMNVQDAFVKDEISVICATIAFGMGIDKSNVRFVIHYNLPKNLESYYQEIGRAGRDGAAADTLLFYSYNDVLTLEEIINKNQSEQTEVQLTKLERMKHYAEALTCRRRILLNYFSESNQDACNNCDICKNPPVYFDGTILAQKALSAVYRLREKVGMNMLVNVLRGAQRKDIRDLGYDQIKTYGAGRDLSFGAWQYYLQQFVNLGYLEMTPHQGNVLRLTPLSKGVLFDKHKVELVQFTSYKQKTKEASKAKISVKVLLEQELFNVLKKLRRQLAQQKGIPPYFIFSDTSLEQLVKDYPMTDQDFLKISGVTQQKLKNYGDAFMQAIFEFAKKHPTRYKGVTYKISQELWSDGKSVEQIATERKLSPNTIYHHLAYLYEKGETIDIQTFVDQATLDQITEFLENTSTPVASTKTVFEHFNGKIDYPAIHFAMAHHNRMKESKHS